MKRVLISIVSLLLFFSFSAIAGAKDNKAKMGSTNITGKSNNAKMGSTNISGKSNNAKMGSTNISGKGILQGQ